jgi:cell division protein FtsB
MKKAPRSAAGGALATGGAFLTRLILPALIGLSVYFALFGGEYSVFEVRRVRVQNLELEQRLIESERANDSLRIRAEALDTDSATIERLAREQHGMIREGEVLYRFAPPPTDAVTDAVIDAEADSVQDPERP